MLLHNHCHWKNLTAEKKNETITINIMMSYSMQSIALNAQSNALLLTGQMFENYEGVCQSILMAERRNGSKHGETVIHPAHHSCWQDEIWENPWRLPPHTGLTAASSLAEGGGAARVTWEGEKSLAFQSFELPSTDDSEMIA